MSAPVQQVSIGEAVHVAGLEKRYRVGSSEVRAVDGVDLEVPRGQFLCIMGPSGSGKSTLLHLLAGLLTPTAGSIWIGETGVHALSQDSLARLRRRRVGMVFQSFNLLYCMTLRQNVALPLLMEGLTPREAFDRVDSLLAELRIEHRAEHRLADLSGGEMQRVAIGRALIADPGVLLADEPTGNLDAAAAEKIFALLRRLCNTRAVTIILVTHDPAARPYVHRELSMEDGRLYEVDAAPGIDSYSSGSSPPR